MAYRSRRRSSRRGYRGKRRMKRRGSFRQRRSRSRYYEVSRGGVRL